MKNKSNGEISAEAMITAGASRITKSETDVKVTPGRMIFPMVNHLPQIDMMAVLEVVYNPSSAK